MCLRLPVGQRAPNLGDDVMAARVLLNAAWRQRSGELLPLSRRADAGLVRRIRYFRERYLDDWSGDWRIRPRSPELERLRRLLPRELDAERLRAIMPRASGEAIGRYWKHLQAEMLARGITTPLRKAHFLAQLAHESGSFVYASELASGEAYEGRADLGNTEPGDGKRFKGRGLIQLTGRANYKAFGASIGTDLTKDGAWTRVATDPALAVAAAGWFWQTKGLNEVADADDVIKVTRKVNGGTNGLEDRMKYLQRARWLLFA